MDEGGPDNSGRKTRPSAGSTSPDATITIRIPLDLPREVTAEDLPLEILHEDEDILVINKASGMHVHPGAGRPTGSLAAALLHHCAGQLAPGGAPDRPGIVHRLDRETTGLLVAAKNDAAHRELSRQFRDRETEKTYLAYVLGRPRGNAGTWEGPIGRHPVSRQRMAIRSRGRPAKTDWKVVGSWPGASLLELRLHTGRTHQIRVHASAAGCPVAGDAIYGGVNSLTRIAKFLANSSMRTSYPSHIPRAENNFPLPLPSARFYGIPILPR